MSAAEQETKFDVRAHFDAKLDLLEESQIIEEETIIVDESAGHTEGSHASSNQPASSDTQVQKKTKKAAPAKKAAPKGKWGWGVTLGLFLVLCLMIAVLWALFISGPVRLEEANNRRVQEVISEQVPDIQGLRETKFDYVTWQGYTDSQFYWFDATGSMITTRDLSTLNYDQARAKALDSYDLDASTVEVAYGYSAPVYRLENNERILMLDYDTLEWVYERKTDYGNE